MFACHCVGKDDLTDRVDLIICLGGDGTLLYASTLFQAWNLWLLIESTVIYSKSIGILTDKVGSQILMVCIPVYKSSVIVLVVVLP